MPHRIILKIRSSVNAKIALIVTLPVVIIMSFFSYHHYTHDRDGIMHSAEVQLLRIGEGFKGPAEAFLNKGDLSSLRAMVSDTARGADIGLITLFSQQETVTASNKGKWTGKSLLDMYPEEITNNDINAIHKAFSGGYSVYYDPEDDQYCLVMPLTYKGNGNSVVLISLDLKNTQAEVRTRLFESAVISLLASALIGVTIFFLFRYMFTNRVKSVSSAAIKFASGDMQVRAEEKGADEIGYLSTSFNVLAEEITNWRNNLEEMAAGRMNELLVLFDVVNTISQSLELNAVLPKVLDCVIDNMGTTKGAIVLIDKDGQSLVIGAQRGLSEESVRRITRSGQGYIGDVILRNKTMRLVAEDEAGSAAVPGLERDTILSALVVPISARGVVLGALAVYSEKRDKFRDEDEALLATIGNQVSVAVLNAQLYEKTLELAQIDGLTGIVNRRYLMERLKQELDRAERYHTSLSVIMLDLDKFKSFNDTYGHLKGDDLLRAFSSMVKAMVRSADIAGRYGGEEFCIVLPNTSVKGAVVIAERIRKAMEEVRVPIDDDRPPAGRTVSIGVAEFSVGDSVEKLISIADAALYRAKDEGRNRVVS